MGLTDRQAADLRKEDAVSKAYQTLIRHKQSNRQQPGLGFHNGLTEAVRELRKDLVEIYAELDGAGEEPLRAELVKVIGDRLSAFIQSSVAGERGLYAATAARQGARLKSMSTVGIERDLDLAVHARTKRETLSAAPAPPAAPVRLKADSEGDLLEQDEEDQSTGSFRSEYELVEKVNIGAFADVWRAKDPFGRTVAAKIVRSSMAEQSSALEHAKALARAEHPNVVRLYTIARIEEPARTAQLQPFEDETQLCPLHLHHTARIPLRQMERAPLRPLGDQAEPVAVPVQHLDQRPLSVEEHEQMPRERILLQHPARLSFQPMERLALMRCTA